MGPAGATRDRLEAVIDARREVELVAVRGSAEDATTDLQDLARRKPATVLIDARLARSDEGRSVIRLVRDSFPILRIVAYGDELDEASMEGLYFLGADAVIDPRIREEHVVAAIMRSPSSAEDDRPPRAPGPDLQTVWEVPPVSSTVEPPEPPAPDVPRSDAPRRAGGVVHRGKAADKDHEHEAVLRNLQRLVPPVTAEDTAQDAEEADSNGGEPGERDGN